MTYLMRWVRFHLPFKRATADRSRSSFLFQHWSTSLFSWLWDFIRIDPSSYRLDGWMAAVYPGRSVLSICNLGR